MYDTIRYICRNCNDNNRKIQYKYKLCYIIRDKDPDQLIFSLPVPDPLLFSSDPESTSNNRYIKSFSSLTKYKPESTNSSLKWFIKSNFLPNYLKYKIKKIKLRSDPDPIFFSAEPDPRGKIGSSSLYIIHWFSCIPDPVPSWLRIILPGTLSMITSCREQNLKII